MVQGVKHFHHYFYGPTFRIRTDHGALTWLLKFKQPECQIACWLQFLSTYDYKIEHRPLKLYGNADALSILVYLLDPCCHYNSQESRDQTNTEEISSEYTLVSMKTMSMQQLPDTWITGKSKLQIRGAQLQDPNISSVLKWKEQRNERPSWAEISSLNQQVKTYVDYWKQLRIVDGV